MEHIQKAIELAIAGGWKVPNTPFTIKAQSWEQCYLLHPVEVARYWQIAISDPLFWQSLGKSLGWKHKFYCDEGSGNSWYCTECGRAKTSETKREFCEKIWIFKWHRFIDHLASGKDAESFFKDLLSNQE